MCDAGARDGEVSEDWFWSCIVNVCKSRGDALTRGSCRDIGLLRRAVEVLGDWSVENGEGCGG